MLVIIIVGYSFWLNKVIIVAYNLFDPIHSSTSSAAERDHWTLPKVKDVAGRFAGRFAFPLGTMGVELRMVADGLVPMVRHGGSRG